MESLIEQDLLNAKKWKDVAKRKRKDESGIVWKKEIRTWCKQTATERERIIG